MKTDDKVKLLPYNPLTFNTDLKVGAEGRIIEDTWVDANPEHDEKDGFWVEWVNPRGLKERWLTLPSEMEVVDE